MAYRLQKIGILIQIGKFADAAKQLVKLYAQCDGNEYEVARKTTIGRSTLKRWRATLDGEGYDVSGQIARIRETHRAM